MNKDAVESLWWGKKQFQDLLESLNVGVVVHGPKTEILFSNQSANHLLGLTKEQMMGKEATDPRWKFIRDDGSSMPLEEFPVQQVKLTLQPVRNLVLGVRRPDLDQPIWVMCNAHPEFNESGQLALVIVSFTEITEEKILKEKLAEVSALFQAAMEQSQVGIAIVDSATAMVKYINKAGISIRGLAQDCLEKGEYISNWSAKKFDGTPYLFEEMPIYKAIYQGQKSSEEFIISMPNQQERVVWSNAAPIFNQQGKITAGIIVLLDITEKHLLKKELEESKKIAENAVNVKTRFLDVAAHELRTPVAAFSLLIQLTERNLLKGIPVDALILKRLRNQAERISRLVVDLLDVSRLEKNIVRLKLETLDIGQLIQECLEETKLRAPEREIEFKYLNSALLISADKIRIFQVISNLIDNAIKYTPVNTKIEIELLDKEKTVKVTVKDHGVGISELMQKEIFNPLTRGSSDDVERSSGLGLGLYISKLIVEMHEGSIGVTSKVGEGSTFYFELPQKVGDQ
jgi:PAS domain S-box-containing protein